MKNEFEIAHLEEFIKQLNEKVLEQLEELEMAENSLKKSDENWIRINAAIKSLEEVHKVQSYSVKVRYDDYNQGLYNGLELALSIMCDRDPVYAQQCEKEINISLDGKEIAKNIRKHAYTGL